MTESNSKNCTIKKGLPCRRESCIFSGKRSMCQDLDRAGVPNKAKWRSLILYFRSLGDQAYLEKEQQHSLQQLVIQTIQARDYSDECYQKLIQDMQDIMNTPLQRKLEETLLETATIASEYGKVLNKNKNRVSDLGENTVRDIQSGVDTETMVENIRSSFREIVSGMEKDIAMLRSITEIDSLTGLFNRRALDDFLSDKLNTKNSSQDDLQFLLLDLDHFKTINDTYGHPVGDYVLQTVADILKQPGEIYSKDSERIYFPARYGGEEFAICLKGFTIEEAVEVGENLRTAIRNMALTVEEDNGEHVQIKITISIGAAKSNVSSPHPVTDILSRADTALYEAKHNGRDRLEIDEASR